MGKVACSVLLEEIFINRKGGAVMAEGYCVKCKEKKEMVGPQEVMLKNNKKAVRGKCPNCGTGMFKITGKI